MCYAIMEKLLEIGCPTILVTHFDQITELSELSPQMRNYHFKSRDNVNGDKSISFQYNLKKGPYVSSNNLGIKLAEGKGCPKSFIDNAKYYSDVLKHLEISNLENENEVRRF